MIVPGIHSRFTFDGKAFQTEAEWIAFMDANYPGGAGLLRSWFSGESIQVKTSGSTGTQKNIVFTPQQMMESARASGRYFELGAGTKALLCLPLDFIAGKMMLIRAITLGWELKGVEPNIHLNLENREQYDFAAMIPLQLENNLESLSRIDTLIVGGAPVSSELQARIKSVSTSIFATYGMTETITHVAVRPLNRNAIQKVLGRNRTFSDEAYSALPGVSFYTDKRGCLVVRCPRISVKEIVTNDLVELISENSFIWKGRVDNVINSGGLKLMPEVIEEKFSKCISQRFFAAGLPDSELGERLIFVVEGEPDKGLVDRLKAFQAGSSVSIQKNELPRDIFYLPKFEETNSGKINRKKTLNHI